MIVDAHNDLLLELVLRRDEERPFERYWAPLLERGGVELQVCPIYTADEESPAAALRAALLAAGAFHRALAESGARWIRAAADLDGDGLGLILSLEGVEPLGRDPSLIDGFWALGVRMVGLTWNRRNAFADGLGEEDDGGLSPLGEALVDRLGELGAMIDLAHASPRTFDAVLARAPDAAVLCSHAGCRAVHDHPRNLSDAQLEALAARGGVLGIMCLPVTVGSDRLEQVVDHVDHAVAVMGIERVGLGGDFIRQVNRAAGHKPISGGLLPPGMPPDAAVAGLEGPEGYPNLVEALRRRGYQEARLDAILGGNLRRLFERGLPA